MAKYSLTARQKDEIRKLTQFANRRIKRAQKVYEQEGRMTVPRELAGRVQSRSQWHTDNTPLSRSVVFNSRDEYNAQIRYLRSFRREAPTVKDYTLDQARVTLSGLETSLGADVPEATRQKILNMTAPELSHFWNTFSDKAVRMAPMYSSSAVLLQTMQELYPEDLNNLLQSSLSERR